MFILKKDGTTKEPFNPNKIKSAISKSAERVCVEVSDEEYNNICGSICDKLESLGYSSDSDIIPVAVMHNVVEMSLDEFNVEIAKAYRDFRNYKVNFVHLMDKIYEKSKAIRYVGEDLSNANTDSTMISTQRSLIYGYFNKEMYQMFFLTPEERHAIDDGYIYAHDMKDRLDGVNCCLFDMERVLKNGFEMGNVWYNEPKTVDTAFDVISDVTLSAASQQYGGFTIPEVDKTLAPYAEKSYRKYYDEYLDIALTIDDSLGDNDLAENADKYAIKNVTRDIEQGFQGWEYKFNTVGSSRGDYPFIAVSFGIGTNRFEKLISEVCLRVRAGGQGKKGYKKPVLFPKLTFLYDENLHGVGAELEYLFDKAIECSSKCMYPDFLSLTGDGYIPSIYKKYGRVISLMGCRASLSPWYERGGMNPADDSDKPVFVGRCNMGAISLHLPMILAKSREEDKDFYEVLDYYLEMIRKIHKRTYEYLGKKKASTNPLAFMQGGFLGGNLKSNDCIAPLLKPMTMSFGITALNELQELYDGNSLVTGGEFALEVMKYINDKVVEFKNEDNILYAIYGTPAESLCFSGETEVQTYGGNKKIKDLTTNDLVYSFNEKLHKIELKPVVYSGLTKRNAQVVKVKLDTEQEIVCTPDHLFAVRLATTDDYGRFSGRESIQWVRALDLIPNMRIKSNYIKIDKSNGRPQCSVYYNGKRQYIQDIHAEYAYGEKPNGYVTHHKDEDKLNNLFENLEYKTEADHKRHHLSQTIEGYQFTSESQTGENNSFYGKHHSEDTKLKNRQAHIGRSIECFNIITKNHVARFECANDVELSGYTRHSVVLACKGSGALSVSDTGHGYRGLLWYYTDECQELLEKNHKVVSVEVCDELIDVYDITVEDNHNFFVGGDQGMLVHNCGLQVKQYRKKYGVVEGVSDRQYVSNSFHCHVSENIAPVQKQDLEERFWNYFNGGKIQYCRYPVNYNLDAVKTLVRRAMRKGFYEGVNLSLAYCEECGYEQLEMDECPKCGSTLITKIDRMNGLTK